MSQHLPPLPFFRPGVLLTPDRSGDFIDERWISESEFGRWFDREIKPLFENAVEVTSQEEYNAAWKAETKLVIVNIKEESADDILRELIKVNKEFKLGLDDIAEKARKYLEGK